MVSLYSDPNANLLKESSHTLCIVHYQSSEALHVINTKSIVSVIAAMPFVLSSLEKNNLNICMQYLQCFFIGKNPSWISWWVPQVHQRKATKKHLHQQSNYLRMCATEGSSSISVIPNHQLSLWVTLSFPERPSHCIYGYHYSQITLIHSHETNNPWNTWQFTQSHLFASNSCRSSTPNAVRFLCDWAWLRSWCCYNTVWTPTLWLPDTSDRPVYFLFNLLNLATPL